MRIALFLVTAGLCALAAPSYAQDLAATCRASSSYDITVTPGGLVFDRADPAPHRVQMHDGNLNVDGVAARLNAEDQDRLALFEQTVRTLMPKVKAAAQDGVELAARAVREEAATLSPESVSSGELDRRLGARVAEIKQRIAVSNSTRDWQGDAFDRYANQIAADILPLIASDLTQRGVDMTMSGDLAGAADLSSRASSLANTLPVRVQQRLQALRPQVQALCPSIQRLYELQDGVRAPDGAALNLLHVGG
jgi:Protein of unknown function (DUF2884)